MAKKKRKKLTKKDTVKVEKMKTAEKEIVQNRTKSSGTIQSPVKKFELSLKTKFTSFGQKKEIDNTQKEKTVIIINYYKEHYGIRSLSSQNIPSKLEKEHKVTNTEESTEEKKRTTF